MEFEYNGVTFHLGDMIEFDDYGTWAEPVNRTQSKLEFGEYPDEENYDVHGHLGFYVKYHDLFAIPLPDVINYRHGRLVY